MACMYRSVYTRPCQHRCPPMYQIVPDCTRLHQIVPDCTRLCWLSLRRRVATLWDLRQQLLALHGLRQHPRALEQTRLLLQLSPPAGGQAAGLVVSPAARRFFSPAAELAEVPAVSFYATAAAASDTKSRGKVTLFCNMVSPAVQRFFSAAGLAEVPAVGAAAAVAPGLAYGSALSCNRHPVCGCCCAEVELRAIAVDVQHRGQETRRCRGCCAVAVCCT